MPGWFKVLTKNGCWRTWGAGGIVQAQRRIRGPNAPKGEDATAVRWRAIRIEPAGSRLQGWGRTRGEAFEALMAKEAERAKKGEACLTD